MNEYAFQFDGCKLPPIPPDEPIETPYCAIKTEETERILTYCKDETLGENPSDYEKFSALLHAFPLLDGNPVREETAYLWHCVFSDSLPLIEENREELWRRASQFLLESPVTLRELIVKESLSPAPSISVPAGEAAEKGKIVSLDSLTESSELMDPWTVKTERILDAAGKVVSISLPEDYVFLSPDPYHVVLALQKEKKETEDRNLLLGQLLRAACKKRDRLSVILDVYCDVTEALKLISRMAETVGLAKIYFKYDGNKKGTEALLKMLEEPAGKEIYPMLRLSSLRGEDEQKETLSFIAARYPIGKLLFSADCDLRLSGFTRSKVRKILSDLQ